MIQGLLFTLVAFAPLARATSGANAMVPTSDVGSAHAPLHPVDANLFIELADAQAALAAMGDSPWRRFLASEGMQKLFDLLTSVGVDPRLAASDVLPKGVLDEDSPLHTLVRASLSLSGVDRPRTGSAVESTSFGWQAMLDFPNAEKANTARELFAHWAQWRPDPQAAQGAIELGARELTYARFINGSTPADAAARATDPKDGAVAQPADETGSRANDETTSRAKDDAGSRATDDASSRAKQNAAAAANEGKPAAEIPVSWLLVDGSRLVLGSGSSTPEHFAARLRGTHGLPSEEQLFRWSEPFTPSSGVQVLQLYSALEGNALASEPSRTQRLAMEFLLPTLLPFVGAHGIWRYELRSERFVTESAFKPYAESGLCDKHALEARGAAYVPKEALGAWIPHLDPVGLERELRALFAPTQEHADSAGPDKSAGHDSANGGGTDHGHGRTAQESTSIAAPPTTPPPPPTTPPPTTPPPTTPPPATATSTTPTNPRTTTSATASDPTRAKANASNELPGFADALGTAAAAYLLPLTNIQSPLPRIVLVVEVKDAVKLERALDAWGAALVKERKDTRWTKKTYRKHPLWELSNDGPNKQADESKNAGGMTPGLTPQPTLALLDDRLILALKLSVAQAEVRRIVDGKPFEAHAIGGGGHFPNDAFEASVMDWSGYTGKLLDLLKGLAPMLAQMGGPTFDASGLPDSALLAKHFQPTWSWSKELADGRTFTHSESSFGPDTPATIGAFVLGLLSSQSGEALRGFLPGGIGALGADRSKSSSSVRAGEPNTPAKSASSGQPAPSNDATHSNVPKQAAGGTDGLGDKTRKHAGAADKGVNEAEKPSAEELEASTLRSLRELKTGLAVYRLQSGRVPPQLDELLKPTDAFPKGFLPASELPRDAWNHAFVYAPDADGKKYKLRSLGPDGIDQQGAGDDVLAP